VSCPKCGAAAVVPGRMRNDGNDIVARFRPSGLRWLTLRRACELVATFRACSNCGHLWNRVAAPKLRALVDASGSPELLDQLRRRAATTSLTRCPACDDPVFVEGSFAWVDEASFEPDRLRHAPPFRAPLRLGDKVRACAGCGHAWSMIDPAELRRLL
jgi:hypothetical protein